MEQQPQPQPQQAGSSPELSLPGYGVVIKVGVRLLAMASPLAAQLLLFASAES